MAILVDASVLDRYAIRPRRAETTVDTQNPTVPDAQPTILARNGTVVEVGGIYLVFSGDSELPYAVTKVISVGGSGGAAMDCQLSPSLTPIPSPDLWLKIFYTRHTEPPNLQATLNDDSRILPISANMFLAWGEPEKFPIRIGTEAVTSEELAACG